MLVSVADKDKGELSLAVIDCYCSPLLTTNVEDYVEEHARLVLQLPSLCSDNEYEEVVIASHPPLQPSRS